MVVWFLKKKQRRGGFVEAAAAPRRAALPWARGAERCGKARPTHQSFCSALWRGGALRVCNTVLISWVAAIRGGGKGLSSPFASGFFEERRRTRGALRKRRSLCFLKRDRRQTFLSRTNCRPRAPDSYDIAYWPKSSKGAVRTARLRASKAAMTDPEAPPRNDEPLIDAHAQADSDSVSACALSRAVEAVKRDGTGSSGRRGAERIAKQRIGASRRQGV